ncbi:kinesin-like protein Klp61F [Hylaeus anthracinus]|uniref:kinesin-like protein Klp61F n=1 Tax=Hylaeus anthracinus TaxID=313031 RepID=UPI0023B8CC29|nr:kinesin-like protein Klp61F [Hylaeus anthracinus]
MNETRNESKKDKKQHIQVFVRVRPINNAEKGGKAMTVVDTPCNREVIIRERSHDKFTKKFVFDRVFGPSSRQIDVYNAVVHPLVEEVLAGYNCTVFAYGQTGTGKTFTMEGVDIEPSFHWQTDTRAGIIPRALSHLFDQLRLLGDQEYSVRVTFLELYNEEVYDLLSSNTDAAKIRIYEDSTKKGAVIVHGLQEVAIHNKLDVFQILQKGSEKRQTAATLLNANSSRSHTIFSITIHIKENTIDGDELLKTGKLNLVDLAGSENVGRSGAIDRRAREAGSINQSLLTLGRVITALVEKTPHVPYRESKLTRLLQESLGGRTRTSIIATVSPASINLEETLSTLDYAHRAKNVMNRPEVNQKFSKKALLQEYTEEIEKLKKDLSDCRERNGVYLAPDNYNQMQLLKNFQDKEIEHKLHHIKAVQDTLNYKQKLFDDLQLKNSEQANQLSSMKNQLETTKYALITATSHLTESEQEKTEIKHLVEKHASTESVLLSQVETVLNVVDTATADVQKLHDKVYRKMEIAQRNSSYGQQTNNNVKERCRKIEADIGTKSANMIQFYMSLKELINAQTQSLIDRVHKSDQHISNDLLNPTKDVTDKLTSHTINSHLRYQEWCKKEIESITATTEQECNVLRNSCNTAQKIQQLMDNKLPENLRDISNDVSQKMDSLVVFTNDAITSISKHSTMEYDRINNNLTDIRRTVDNIRQNLKSIMEKENNFAKMMNDLQHCFNKSREEDKEKHSSIHVTLQNIDEVSNLLSNEVSDIDRIQREKENSIQEKLQDDSQEIKQMVKEETEKLRTLSENAIAQSKRLVNEFQTNLYNACDTLINYKSYIECNMRKIQEKMKTDETHILSSINDIYTTVYEAGNERTRSLSTWKSAFINASTEIMEKLDNENTNAAYTNSRIISEMQVIRDRVDKFFTDDLYRDVPTGSTPSRKTFQYSKKLPRTSPPDRILKRYRESLNKLNNIEDEYIPEANHEKPITEILEEGLNIS